MPFFLTRCTALVSLLLMLLPVQVRALKARKSVAPAVATVAGSIEAAPLQTPIGTSSFWGCAGAGEPLPPNPDAAALLPLYKHLPFSFRGSRWSEEEQQRLRDGVLQLVQVRAPGCCGLGWPMGRGTCLHFCRHDYLVPNPPPPWSPLLSSSCIVCSF